MLLYLNGAFIDAGEARISVLDRGFIFGDGVYEVWRVLRGRMYEPERHLLRLGRGMRELRIQPPQELSAEGLARIADRVLTENGLREREATLYVEVSRGAAPRTHYFPPASTRPTVLVMASPFAPSEARVTGTAVITQPDVRWLRCDIKTVQLLPNVLARQAAVEAGASEAIFVRDGMITEGTHTTVFGVIDGIVRTHPANHLVLPGVTRDVVIDIAKEASLAVAEQGIAVEELPRAEELFLTGTTTDVTPVVCVDGATVGRGSPGPIAHMLLERLVERMAAEPVHA